MPKIVDEQMREATRQRILREAAREFARLWFDQANINLIAEQAGIGKGTIYLYFENKREVFLAMLRSIAQTQLATIRATLLRYPLPATPTTTPWCRSRGIRTARRLPALSWDE